MTQLDLALPGVLALLLSRTHQSSYRAGRMFGAFWSSTLDQRLEIDAQGVACSSARTACCWPSRPRTRTLFNAAFEYGDSVTTMTNSLGQATACHFNEALQVVKIVDPLGGETISEWDAYDRLLARTDALGRTTRYEYGFCPHLLRAFRSVWQLARRIDGEHVRCRRSVPCCVPRSMRDWDHVS